MRGWSRRPDCRLPGSKMLVASRRKLFYRTPFVTMNMIDRDTYLTIDRGATAEFKDRGSRFIGHTFPASSVEECKQQLNDIKKLHAKATHHCFAWRLGLEGLLFRVSDAGEPSGTAGRPILGQIDSKQLVNVQIIVVRYFGGTLL